jgi:hypothetical protein
MADTIDPPKLFDVEVDHFARSLTFVATNRVTGFQGCQFVQAKPPLNATDGGRRDAKLGGDLLAGAALPAPGLDRRASRLRGLAWR